MSGIESSLGKKTFSSTTPGRKVLNVTDESMSYDQLLDQEAPMLPQQLSSTPKSLTPEEFNQYQAQKAEIIARQKKLSPEAKARVEALIGIGRMTTDVEVGEYKFTLQTLKAKESREITKDLLVLNGSDQFHEVRAQTLARAIININDYPTNVVLGTDDIKTIVDFVWDLEDSVATKLYDAYATMVNQVKNKLNAPAKLVEEIKK